MLSNDLIAGAEAAARECGLKPRQIYYMVENGQLACVRMGKRLYFRRTALDRAFSADTV